MTHQRIASLKRNRPSRGRDLQLLPVIGVVITVLAGFLLTSTMAYAEAPSLIPVQGVLNDAQGDPVDGDTTITFSIYASEVAATPEWTESQTVDVSDGVFVVYLGAVTSLPLTMFRDNGDLWLGVAVETDSEMDRVHLGSTPYAGYAEYCGNAPDHAHDFGDLTGNIAAGSLPASAVVGAQSCAVGQVVTGIDAIGAVVCAVDADTLYDGNEFATSSQSCTAGLIVTGVDSNGSLVCAIDADTLYTGNDFATSSQSCTAGQIVTGIDGNGLVTCALDANTVYSGNDFATSSQGCAVGEVVTGIGASGQLLCAADANTLYSGTDFTLSNQTCGAGDVVTGVDANGAVSCNPDGVLSEAAVETFVTNGDLDMGGNGLVNIADPVVDGDAANKLYVDTVIAALEARVASLEANALGATYRWATWSTYSQAHGNWYATNNSSLFGGITPSIWTDGNGMADAMSSDSDILRALYVRRGPRIGTLKNANVFAEEWYSYSSTNGRLVSVLFRVRNNTGASIIWNVNWYNTAYGGWGERSSIALNGTNVWNSGGSNFGANHSSAHSISIPANRTSTVIFVASSSSVSGTRAVFLAYTGDSLVLPAGLEYVDDLDTKPNGWTN